MDAEITINPTTRKLQTADQLELHVRQYPSRRQGTSRTLLIVHGVCEHGGRYSHVADAATKAGWQVVIADQRGHGLSSGRRTHVKRFDEYVRDVELVREDCQLSPHRTAVLGHSMGGLIAIRFAQRHPQQLAALAVSSPLLRVGTPPHRLVTAVGRVLSLVAPRTRFATGIDPSLVTRDEEIIRQRELDPLIEKTVTARWYFAAQSGIRQAWKGAPQMDLPLLVLQGGADSIVDPVATECWAESAGGLDKTLYRLPGHLHELLNETDRQETLQKILAWLDARIPT